MSEIAHLFESALRNNRSSLLRRAAMNTVARMPLRTTLRELLESDAGDAVRELTLRELGEALAEIPGAARRQRIVAVGTGEAKDAPTREASREERLFRDILAALEAEPLTIGQIAKRLGLESEELRGYLTWMKKMGKVRAVGRARATRYHPVR
jgi:predicted Rossmann fold nucleotide-binding protein DprA/Smf involved in DNA uptake